MLLFKIYNLYYNGEGFQQGQHHMWGLPGNVLIALQESIGMNLQGTWQIKWLIFTTI